MAKKNSLNQYGQAGRLVLFFGIFLLMAVPLAAGADAHMTRSTTGDRVMGTGAAGQDGIFMRDMGTGDLGVSTPKRPDVDSYDQRYNFAPEVNMDVNWWTFPRPLPGPSPKPYDGVSPSTNLVPGVTGKPGRDISAGKDLPPPRAYPGLGAHRPTPGALPDTYSRPTPGAIPGAGSRPSPGALPGQGW